MTAKALEENERTDTNFITNYFPVQENQNLQTRIAQTSATEEMKSMHDELSILDEVR